MFRAFFLTFLLGVALFAGIAWLGYRSGSGSAVTGALKSEPLLNSTETAGWSEPDSFMGWKFGENLRAQLSTCSPNWISSRTPCIEDMVKDTFEIKNVYVGDRKLGIVYARQISNRLEQITVVFPSDRYSEISSLFLERYGKPSTTKTETRKFQAGATLSSNVMKWVGKNVNIVLQERGDKANEGLAFYSTVTWRATKEAENKRQAQEAVKGL
ncbi:MAG: hypothetical protein GEU77_19040 [Deltaproteobacteria bacterium]|nr:hypothetical protein [Deltaproteobacteria bacterium]